MRKSNYTIFFTFIFLCNILFAQKNNTKKFNFKWNDNIEFILGKDKKIITSLIDNNFLNEFLLPTFSDYWEIDKGLVLESYSVKNIVYENVLTTSNNLFFKNHITAKPDVKLKVTNDNKKSLIVFELVPYINSETGLKRIISLEIEYSLANKTLNKFSKSASVKNSVLSTGSWYKFAIDTTGVFKIDKSFLQKLGVDVNNVNPKNIQIFGNGGEMLPFKNSDFRYDDLQENAIFVSGEEDASFDTNDYILFYAKGPHSWDTENNEVTSNIKHQFNIFSDKAYYFLTIGNNEGKRVGNMAANNSSTTNQITTFNDYTFYEKDEVNLLAFGQQWFGDDFSIQNTYTYKIPFENINTSKNVFVRVRGVSESSFTSQMYVKVNNQSLFTINLPAISGLNEAVAAENYGELLVSDASIEIEVSYNNNGNPSANAFLDYIEIIGEKKLIATGNQFSFRNFDVSNSSEVFEYKIENASNISYVWNVSNALNPYNIQNQSLDSNFIFKVTGGTSQEYIVLNEGDYYTPQVIETSYVANQNLHSLSNIDYLIVTQEFLKEQAQVLADYHTNNSGFNTLVVSISDIYNEFSSGSPDITGIRDFVKHLYDNSTTNPIKYVCLFGDASYDYKDRINGNNNIVPAFQSYESFNPASTFVTDDFYGMMDDNEGEMSSFERQDVATGRIPVSDALEAEKIVAKILDYYSVEAFGDWRTQITLIADDIDATGEETIEINMEKLADSIAKNQPLFNLKKIYFDAYTQEYSASGSSYPSVNLDINNEVEKGTLMVNYFGHGGENGWASEGVLGVSDIQSWSNEYKLPLFVTITCQFSRFDNPLRETAGEYVFWNESGGAASLITTTREVYISVGQAFNEVLIEPLLNFNNEDYTISEALMHSKNEFTTLQRYFIYMLGDPAMKLAVPKPNIKLTKMNDIEISKSLDTIKALSLSKFEGEITDVSGSIISDFNGEIDVLVYDKSVTKTTLDNDNNNITMEFDALESKIFKGRSKVENGLFTFDFIAPKDIKIAYGKGKLSFYATNNSIDKAGYSFDVTVGGINNDAPEDNTGPVVKLYMNDLNFVDGGNTNESPLFIAVIEDESGINTSITAVDHDIVAILDGDQSNPIILNDYYETELNDYKKGKVNYPFSDLSAGLHTITLKVWDTYNNLSETTFNFFVVDDSDMVLSHVLNYPNPFVNYTEFWFNHNKPNELLSIQVQIFTVTGKLVKTINETTQTEGNLCRSIIWNGLDDYGSKIGKGVYVYKLKVKSLNSGSKAEKIEKLVILQ